MAAGFAAIITTIIPVTMQIQAFAVVTAASIGLFIGRPIMILTCGLCLGIISLWICACAANSGSNTDFSDLLAAVYTEPLDLNQSLELYYNWLHSLMLSASSALLSIPVMLKFAAIVITVIALGAGFIFRQLVGAIGCSIFGTGMIFFGMITLLLYKGSQPLSSIYNRPAFYAAVAACMIIFGSVAGFMLCCEKPVEIDESLKKKKSDKTKNGERK